VGGLPRRIRTDSGFSTTASSLTLVIADNDVTPNVWIDSVVHGKERSNDGIIILKRSDTTHALTVNYTFDSSRSTATFNTDFTFGGTSYSYGSVTFVAGSATAEIVINVKDDAIDESDETIFVRLNDPGSSGSVLQYTLDETRRDTVVLILGETTPVTTEPKVWIDSATGAVEPGTDGMFVLWRDNADNALTVNFTFDSSYSTASLGTDFTIDGMPYSYSTGSVTFAAGQFTAEIIIRVPDRLA